MVRKLTVSLLVVGLCLMGVIPVLAQKIYPTLAEYEKTTGKKIEKFNEAPSLKTKVAADELPSVEERLPKDPVVIEPLEEIGRYGGTLRTFADAPTGGSLDPLYARVQYLFRITPDFKTVVPNIGKGWDLSEDQKSLTVYLREGMKWSDGTPFTADDFLFWYNDIILNDELTPVKPTWLLPGGELAKMEKIDDYTIRFHFATPCPSIIVRLATEEPFASNHYLGKYHIKYNPNASKIAKEEGYDYWWQCFQFHNLRGAKQQDLTFPVLDSFVLRKADSFGNRYYERNPYFYKVDSAGNQLPYIDEVARILVENLEARDLKAIAGEFDIVGYRMNIGNYPLYKKGEEKGNYHVDLWSSARNESSYVFNYTHKDPVLRKIFNDIKFRQAMSLAINREEINKVFFFEKAIPRQHAVVPFSVFYEHWMGKYYAEYDTEEANKLLDEMDLSWDKKHQYRLRPDGKTLAVTIHLRGAGIRDKVCELVKEYWENVGVKVALKPVSTSFYQELARANELDINYGPLSADDLGMFVAPSNRLYPPWGWGPGIARPWYNWYTTGGESGEEPPEKVKELFRMAEEWQKTLPESEEYMRLGKRLVTTNLKNLYQVGTVGMAPWPFVVKNKLKNVIETGYWVGFPYCHFLPSQPEQWFFKK